MRRRRLLDTTRVTDLKKAVSAASVLASNAAFGNAAVTINQPVLICFHHLSCSLIYRGVRRPRLVFTLVTIKRRLRGDDERLRR